MAKTVSAPLSIHLAQPTTTLALCVCLERADGIVMGFTSHDRQLTVSSQDYEPATAYIGRSSIVASGRFDTDNYDFDAVMDSAAITDQDLRNGIYDNAQIRIFLVNHQSVGDGEIKLAAGRLGEVSIGQHAFHAEVRRLSQAFSRTLLELYTATCRADFTDTRCGVDWTAWRYPVRVATVTDQRTFTVEEAFEFTIGANTLANGGAETGATAPWQSSGGDNILSVDTGIVHAGTYSLSHDSYIYWGYVWQRVDLLAAGVPADTIDAGLLDVQSQLWGRGGAWASSDAWFGHSRHYLDASQVEISNSDTGNSIRVKDLWEFWDLPASLVPAGTRYIDFKVSHKNDLSSIRMDECELNVNYMAESGTPTDIPELDTADYFLRGGCRWLTGNNAGSEMEIAEYNNGTYSIGLFQGMPHEIQVGDWLWLVRGCDKTMATCRDTYSNIVNFRGEPYVPGKSVLDYPDAHL